MRILAAMSGGVDSAVAAARMVQAGHDVVGIHLALSLNPQTLRTGSRGCCSREDSHDARRAADMLGIPFYVWDFADRFKANVIDPFIAAYEAGDTPNPCLLCNEKIKFQALAEKAFALGFDAIATGHYAQVHDGILYRAKDIAKDQSYVLASLTRDQLRRCFFPLGDAPSKQKVRQQAAELGLSVAHKPDSHDICFIPSGDTRAYLGAKIGLRPGIVIDQTTGEKVAEHEGTYGFTIGQRKGLGTLGPATDGQPRYVTAIDTTNSIVTIGRKEDLQIRRIITKNSLWSGTHPGPIDCHVQIRAHGDVVPAVATHTNDTITLELAKPIMGVATGQLAVAYRPATGDDVYTEDAVLGAGTIAQADTPAMTPQ